MTDQQLQLALAKMLPDQLVAMLSELQSGVSVRWKSPASVPQIVKDTEWLHICWLVEQTLGDYEVGQFNAALDTAIEESNPSSLVRAYTSPSWQLRAQALCKVKGI